MTQHLLLVSSLPPSFGTGSPIILKRHLERLTGNGWRVSVAAPAQRLSSAEPYPPAWRVIPLSGRRWWWPPVRAEIPASVQLRLPLWQQECENALGNERPDAILTFLCDIHPLLAEHLSRQWQVPLGVIIHDHEALWASSAAEQLRMERWAQRVITQASRVWPVSQELGDCYGPAATGKVSVLPPIPAQTDVDRVPWQPHFQTHPVVAHAGRLHPFQYPNFFALAQALQTVNGTLLVVAPRDNPTLIALQATCPNVRHQEPFQENAEVIQFLAHNASSILVSYAFSHAEQPWAATSFPSKLIEFAQLGLPSLLLAPPGTATANWAKHHHWLSQIDSLDSAVLKNLVDRLTHRESWQAMAQQTQTVARQDFHPEVIQHQLETELTELTQSRPHRSSLSPLCLPVT